MGNAQAAEPALDDEFADEPAGAELDDDGAAGPASLWNSFASYTPNFREGMTRAMTTTATQYPRLRRTPPSAAELDVVRFVAATESVDFCALLPPEIISRILNHTDGEDLLALERTCITLREAVADPGLWREVLESKRRQITFVPFCAEKERKHGCPNWEAKHRYFRSCVWTSPKDLATALAAAEQSALGGEIHLLAGTYKGLLLEGWRVDMSIIGHGDVVIENTSAWRPPIHICSESSLNPAFVKEQLYSYVAGYVPKTLSDSLGGASSYIMPEYLSSLFRSASQSPTVVLEGLRVVVGASAEQISTFPIYVEGRTHVVIHRCTVVGQRLSAILVSKGAMCDVIDSDVGHSVEDGVFFVGGSGSVRGCRIHHCGMNAVEVRGASSDIIVENNIICGNGSALHVPWREEAATELQAPQDQWGGKVHFLNNQVLDSVGPSLRIETCERNPFVGVVCGNVLQGNAEQRPLAKKLQDALDSCVCTRSATGNEHSYQPWFECKTCRLDAEHVEKGICASCVRTCHADHETFQRWIFTKSFCDCGCVA